jgi:NADH-quinone oxidoreductase subunit K
MPTLPELGLYFSILLFIVGLFGVMFRKGILFMMLSVEIMLNAANLAFVSASSLTNTMDGQVIMFFVMAVAACEAGIGLALVVALYRARATVEVDDLRMLRG